MDDEIKLTKDDIIFFMDMVGSWKSPNHVPKINKAKPLNNMLKDRDSTEYKRFIMIYKATKHILLEREMVILDEIYCINGVKHSLKTIGEIVNLSAERVRQLHRKAENKIVTEILRKLKEDTYKV